MAWYCRVGERPTVSIATAALSGTNGCLDYTEEDLECPWWVGSTQPIHFSFVFCIQRSNTAHCGPQETPLLPYSSLSNIVLFHLRTWESAVDSLSISRTFRPSYWRVGMPKATSAEYFTSSGAAEVLRLCWCQPLLNSRNRGYSSGIIPPHGRVKSQQKYVSLLDV